MRSALAFAMVLAIPAATGCATGPSGSVLGRPVAVVPPSGAKGPPVKGELIAVEPERIWVLGKTHVFEVPMAEVGEVRVQRHWLDARHGWSWTAVGALATGGALAFACSSVDGNDGCGGVFAGVALTWLVLGGLPSALLDRSATIHLEEPGPEALRPYARYPQGPPEGLDLRQLPPAPGQVE